ncbi:MAG: hypothetical protein IJX64_04760, partial [Clostridia bacterium]|nr:hypothetical protein [Clostridia bacterium]
MKKYRRGGVSPPEKHDAKTGGGTPPQTADKKGSEREFWTFFNAWKNGIIEEKKANRSKARCIRKEKASKTE